MQKEKPGKDILCFGKEKAVCVARESGKSGCICPGLTLWFPSSLEEGERSHQTSLFPTVRFEQRQKVW